MNPELLAKTLLEDIESEEVEQVATDALKPTIVSFPDGHNGVYADEHYRWNWLVYKKDAGGDTWSFLGYMKVHDNSPKYQVVAVRRLEPEGYNDVQDKGLFFQTAEEAYAWMWEQYQWTNRQKNVDESDEFDPTEIEQLAYKGVGYTPAEEIVVKAKELTVKEVLRATAQIEGRRRLRIIHQKDAEDFVKLVRQNPLRRVRVYSSDGFVALAYSYTAPITRLCWDGHNGTWHAEIADAKRSSKHRYNTRIVEDFDPEEVERVASTALSTFPELNQALKNLGLTPNHENLHYEQCVWTGTFKAPSGLLFYFRVVGTEDANDSGWGIVSVHVIIPKDVNHPAESFDWGNYSNCTPSYVVTRIRNAIKRIESGRAVRNSLLQEDFDPEEVARILDWSTDWEKKMAAYPDWKLKEGHLLDPVWYRFFMLPDWIIFATIRPGTWGRFLKPNGEPEESIEISASRARPEPDNRTPIYWTSVWKRFYRPEQLRIGIQQVEDAVANEEVLESEKPQQEGDIDPGEAERVAFNTALLPTGDYYVTWVRPAGSGKWHIRRRFDNRIVGHFLKTPGMEDRFTITRLDPKVFDAEAALAQQPAYFTNTADLLRHIEPYERPDILKETEIDPEEIEQVAASIVEPTHPDFNITRKHGYTHTWDIRNQDGQRIGGFKKSWLTGTYLFTRLDPAYFHSGKAFIEGPNQFETITDLLNYAAKYRKESPLREDIDPEEVEQVAQSGAGPFGIKRIDSFWHITFNGQDTGEWHPLDQAEFVVKALNEYWKDNKSYVFKEHGFGEEPFDWYIRTKYREPTAALQAKTRASRLRRRGRVREDIDPEEAERVANSVVLNRFRLSRQDQRTLNVIDTVTGEVAATFSTFEPAWEDQYGWSLDYFNVDIFDEEKIIAEVNRKSGTFQVGTILSILNQCLLSLGESEQDIDPEEAEALLDPLHKFNQIASDNGFRLMSTTGPVYKGEPKITEWDKEYRIQPNNYLLAVAHLHVGVYWDDTGKKRVPQASCTTWWNIGQHRCHIANIFVYADDLIAFLQDLQKTVDTIAANPDSEIDQEWLREVLHNHHGRLHEGLQIESSDDTIRKQDFDPEEIETVATAPTERGLRFEQFSLPGWGDYPVFHVYDGTEHLGVVGQDLAGAWVIVRSTLDKDPDPHYATAYQTKEEAAYSLRNINRKRRGGYPSFIQRRRAAESQEFTSAQTCLKQVPALHKWLVDKKLVKEGMTVLDLGGGKYDLATDFLKEHGVTNLVWDPYNRPPEHNFVVMEKAGHGQVDAVICSNTLNVIKERARRIQVVARAAEALKEGGSAYFSVYKRPEGKGRSGKDAWQEGRTIQSYLPEIKKCFEDVRVVKGFAVATKPIPEGITKYLKEDIDPEEVESTALQALDTDRHRLTQLLQMLQGDYPVVTHPSITYFTSNSDKDDLIVYIDFFYDDQRTSPWVMSNRIYKQAEKLGISLRSGMGINDQLQSDPIKRAEAWVKIAFVMGKETKAPLPHSVKLQEWP